MSREAWGDPPDREPDYCPVCGETHHTQGCPVYELDKRRIEAEGEVMRLRAALAEQAAEYDVRTILLGVVPGDGSGHEVYAKSVNEVHAVLTRMGERIEDLESRLAAPAAEQAEPVAQTSAEWERRFLAYDPSSDPAEAECDIPPHGWRCTRTRGHDGPCAAVAAPDDVALVRRSMARLAAAEQAEPVERLVTRTGDKLGAITAGMEDSSGITLLRRLVDSICIINNGERDVACWDHGAMFALRDLLCAAPPAPAPTWPEWAEQILKIVREYSGYDGYDDADGVDLPEEVREALEELTAQITRLEAKAPAPAAAPAGEPAACISRTQGRIYAQLLPAGRSLPLGTSLYPQQSAAMFQPAPARQEPLFLLHTGQIDSGGEQDEWDIEANSWVSVEEFCRAHPGQTIGLNPQPLPAAPITAAPAEGGA